MNSKKRRSFPIIWKAIAFFDLSYLLLCYFQAWNGKLKETVGCADTVQTNSISLMLLIGFSLFDPSAKYKSAGPPSLTGFPSIAKQR